MRGGWYSDMSVGVLETEMGKATEYLELYSYGKKQMGHVFKKAGRGTEYQKIECFSARL